MCISPIKIRNPHRFLDCYEYNRGDVLPLDRRFVSEEEYIEVPCGKCAECRDSYLLSLRQRAQVECMTSYAYMVTLTYDDAHLPYLEFTGDHGRHIKLYYADVSHIQSMIKRLRTRSLMVSRGLRYISVTEYGTNKFRPHHHMILFVSKFDTDTDSTPFVIERILFNELKRLYAINRGTRKHPIYEPLFTYAESSDGKYRNFDCRLIRDYDTQYPDESSVARAVSYVLTYVNKTSRFDSILSEFLEAVPLSDLSTKLRRILSSKVVYSKHFGFGFDTVTGLPVRPSKSSAIVSSVVCDRSALRNLFPENFQDLYGTSVYFETMLLQKYMLQLVHGDSSPSAPISYDSALFRKAFDELFPSVSWSLSSDRTKPLWISHYFSSFPEWTFYLDQRWRDPLVCLAHYEPGFLSAWLQRAHFASEAYYPSFLPASDYNSAFESSAAYKFVRESIEEGLQSDSPFLCFKLLSKAGYVFSPLCAYYRRYCTTLADTGMLYDKLGLANRDEYMKLFTPSLLDRWRKQRRQVLNEEIRELKRPDIVRFQEARQREISAIRAPRVSTLEKIFCKD